jgi:EmrB/QacA subfamily drug resistance transporter
MTARATDRPWWTLAAMCFGLFMIMLDNTIVNVALPSIQRSLHTTPETLQWTIDAYVLTFAVLILLGGKLGDRFGRKRMFLVGLLIFTLASAACAQATTDTQLVAFRAVQGVGAALLNPLSLSIIVAAFPRKQLPTAIGIWAGVSALGLSAGPLIGGLLVERVSWSAVFWVNVPVGIVAAAVTVWAVGESRDEQRRHLDLVGTTLITSGLFAVVYGLIGTNSHAWTSTQTVGLITGAAVLLALFVAWERRAPEPMLPLSFFRNRPFATSAIVTSLVGFAFIGVLFLIVLYFQNVEGYSPLQAGIRTLPLTLTQAVVAVNAGRLSTLLGSRVQLTTGMLMLAAGLLGLAQVHVASPYDRIWPFQVLLGLGMGLAMPAVGAIAMATVPADQSGIASGVINAGRQVGGSLGIAVLGTLAAVLARSQWQHQIALLPLASHAKAAHLTSLVVGGQGRALAAVAGRPAELAGLASFVDGLRGALLASAALALVAAAVAFFGLRRARPDAQELAVPQAVPTPRAA